ncbi:MAG: hypothetical protein IH886_02550 [Nitrospinae bacterium]|nr:hypothetical protein [Nitrospinota bacterium]
MKRITLILAFGLFFQLALGMAFGDDVIELVPRFGKPPSLSSEIYVEPKVSELAREYRAIKQALDKKEISSSDFIQAFFKLSNQATILMRQLVDDYDSKNRRYLTHTPSLPHPLKYYSDHTDEIPQDLLDFIKLIEGFEDTYSH